MLWTHKTRLVGNWLWNPYGVAGIIGAILIITKLPCWKPLEMFPVPPNHFSILIHQTALNAFVFLVGYSVLRTFKTLVFWKFAIYLIALIGVGLFFWQQGLWNTESWFSNMVSRHYWLFFQFIPLVFSVLFNIGFLKYLFGIDTRSAILMGLLIGMTRAESLRLSMPVYSG